MNEPHSSPIQVRHNAAEHRFEVKVDGCLAVADYQIDGERVVFTHTFVPPELRGRGIADKLVRAALEWARAEQWQVVPVCTYVAGFIRKHPEFQGLTE